MTNKDNGGPAFPRPHSQRFQDDQFKAQTGMTLRDYFAAKASEGDVDSIMKMHRTPCDHSIPLRPGEFILGDQPFTITRQQARYMHADLMLLERAK